MSHTDDAAPPVRVVGAAEPDRALLGMGLFSLGVFFLTFTDTAARILAADPPEGYGMPVVGLVMLRCLTGFVAVAVAAAVTRTVPWRTKRLGLHLLRGVIFAALMLCLFNTLPRLPLFLAYTLFFTAPVMIVVLSAVILREPLTWRLLAAVLLGMVGVLVSQQLLGLPGVDAVAREPGEPVDPLGVILALASAVTYAALVLITRAMGTRESFASLLFYSLAVPFVILLIPGLMALEAWPSAAEWGLIAVVGVGGGGCLALIFAGIRMAPAGQVAVLDYTGLVWAALVGWVVFAEVVEMHQIVGAVIVTASGLMVVGPRVVLAMRAGRALRRGRSQ